jgi:YhcH/YjgK/YiaL family protein
MILDALERADQYVTLHPEFRQAFEFLARPDLTGLPPGRHPVDGDRLYVSIDRKVGKGRQGARLEAHRRYIDIQLTLDGAEEIGWLPLRACLRPAGGFDESRDIVFYDDRPETWLVVPPGHFAIFFPADAHAPLAGTGAIHKAIAKIALAEGGLP